MNDVEGFKEFPKIARLTRQCIITEKIDGMNAQICIKEDGTFLTGSRTGYITPENDTHGFSKWAHSNKEELMRLGVGVHFGEWWGSGINRGYGLKNGEKRFSLFNLSRWDDENVRPKCCGVVPLLYQGLFDTQEVENCIQMLRDNGSFAAPGFNNPEGVVVFHIAGNVGFKKTLERDEERKGKGGSQ